MDDVISLRAARFSLSKLVRRAESGETIYIGACGKATVKLVRVDEPTRRVSAFGLLKEFGELPPDLEEPLPAEVIDSFYGVP